MRSETREQRAGVFVRRRREYAEQEKRDRIYRLQREVREDEDQRGCEDCTHPSSARAQRTIYEAAEIQLFRRDIRDQQDEACPQETISRGIGLIRGHCIE